MGKKYLSFEMEIKVMMSRALNFKKVGYSVEPGPFIMTMNSTNIAFDFEKIKGELVDNIYTWHCSEPDFDYEGTAYITEEMLNFVTDIIDIYIPHDPLLTPPGFYPVKLLDVNFRKDSHSGIIKVSHDVIDNFKFITDDIVLDERDNHSKRDNIPQDIMNELVAYADIFDATLNDPCNDIKDKNAKLACQVSAYIDYIRTLYS